MKVPVVIRVEVPADLDAGEGFQVYTDRGTGTVDFTKPLLARPRKAFEGRPKSRGWGRAAWGRGAWGTGRPARQRGGLRNVRWGRTPWGRAPRVLDVEVEIPPAFGVWKFAARTLDAQGNVQPGATVEAPRLVSATTLSPVSSLGYGSYDGANKVVTLNVSVPTE